MVLVKLVNALVIVQLCRVGHVSAVQTVVLNDEEQIEENRKYAETELCRIAENV